MLEIDPPKIIKSSSLNISNLDRTTYLIDIMKATGKTNYLCGWGGSVEKDVFEQQEFSKNGFNFSPMNKTAIYNHIPYILEYLGISLVYWQLKLGKKELRNIITNLKYTFN